MYDTAREVVYLGAGTVFTAAVACRLYRTGRRVLTDAFRGEREISTSVNRMLVGSFCLLMAGYLAATADFIKSYANVGDIVGYDVSHFGGFLMFLGLVLVVHVFVLGRMRGRARRQANHGDSILA